jgi:hypothetical protein
VGNTEIDYIPSVHGVYGAILAQVPDHL